MKRASGAFPWFKAYALPLIEGSVTQTMNDTQQLIWLKLIALARISKFGDGTLRHGEGIPMTTAWIARRLGYSEDQIKDTIDICLRDKNADNGRYRIEIWADGTIELCNFLEYNPQPRLKDKATETPDEQQLRERRMQSILNRKYPGDARLEVTEQVMVNQDTGEIVGKKQTLKQPVTFKPVPKKRGKK